MITLVHNKKVSVRNNLLHSVHIISNCTLIREVRVINKMLKISAFYLEKQKSFVPKKICGMLLSNRDFKKQNFWFLE